MLDHLAGLLLPLRVRERILIEPTLAEVIVELLEERVVPRAVLLLVGVWRGGAGAEGREARVEDLCEARVARLRVRVRLQQVAGASPTARVGGSGEVDVVEVLAGVKRGPRPGVVAARLHLDALVAPHAALQVKDLGLEVADLLLELLALFVFEFVEALVPAPAAHHALVLLA